MDQDTFTLITGASSGIGECFARALSSRLHNLVLAARSEEKLNELAAELRAKHGVRVEVIPADLAVRGAASQLAKALRARNCLVDLLINNAGFGARGEFSKLSLERQSAMVALNVNALVELTYLLLPGMIERRQGAVVNVSSTASFQPIPYTTTYAATKAFVTSFSMGLAEELKPYGIPVVTLCPGGTRTNFFVASRYGLRNLPGGMQAPEAVVEAALAALERGGGLVVPRLINKLSITVQRLMPRELVTKFAARIFRPPRSEDAP
jgi:short-subunit dehydrogenase